MKTLLSIATLLLAFGAPAQMALAVDYFVSGTGSDANDGLSSANAFRTITEAMTHVAAGDRILVETGVYNAGAGEAFPLTVVDGVDIIGPGDGTAELNKSVTPGPVLVVDGDTATQRIEGLLFDAMDTGIFVSGNPGDLWVVDNTFMVGDYGLFHSTSGGNTDAAIHFSSNSVSVSGGTGLVWVAHPATTASHTVVAANNFINPAGGWGLHAGVTSVEGRANFDILYCSNTVTSAGWGLLGWLCPQQTSGTYLWDMVIKDNVVSGYGQGAVFIGFYPTLSSMTSGNVIDANIEVYSNTFVSGNTGVYLSNSAGGSNGVLHLVGRIDCNDISNMSNYGMYLRASGYDSGAADWDLDIRYNYINNASTGIGLTVSAFENMDLTVDLRIMGNVLMNNGAFAARYACSSSGTPTISLPGPLFGSSAAPGLNFFDSGGSFAFSAGHSDLDTVTVNAVGNWWPVSSLAGIESTVLHQVDTATRHLVDFSMPLTDPLNFTVNQAGPGQVATVIAGADTFFIPKAGNQDIQVLVDGVAANAVNVNALYQSLNFVVPIVGLGNQTVTIILPGGQMGTAGMLVITLDDPGGCFVATAAHGDEDAPEVQLLRRWRDECLADNLIGRQFVDVYYALSPGIAGAISDSPMARSVTRAALAPVVGAARLWMDAPWLLALGALGGFWLLRRRR